MRDPRQHRRRRLLTAVSGILASLVMASGLIAINARDSYADPLLLIPFATVSEECWECELCGTDKHKIFRNILNGLSQEVYQSAHAEECNTGFCHPQCGQEQNDERLANLLMAAADEDPEGLAALMAGAPRGVDYNRSRRSIQFVCDQGTLIANIPITIRQAKALDLLEAEFNRERPDWP